MVFKSIELDRNFWCPSDVPSPLGGARDRFMGELFPPAVRRVGCANDRFRHLRIPTRVFDWCCVRVPEGRGCRSRLRLGLCLRRRRWSTLSRRTRLRYRACNSRARPILRQMPLRVQIGPPRPMTTSRGRDATCASRQKHEKRKPSWPPRLSVKREHNCFDNRSELKFPLRAESRSQGFSVRLAAADWRVVRRQADLGCYESLFAGQPGPEEKRANRTFGWGGRQ